MRDKLQSMWSIYLLSLGSIDVKSTKIKGPRVGLCANTISADLSQISSSSLGCKADSGLGAGQKRTGCAGSGGAHGGSGGYGGSESRDETIKANCLESFP